MNEFSGASGQTRRTVLKGAVGLAALGLGAGGALTSAHAAADAKAWPEKAFSAKGEADALKALYGKTGEPSDKVNLDAPEIAENGAVVPIEITSNIAGTRSIAVIAEHNPFPLVAQFTFLEGALPFVKVNIKMGETSDVRVIAEANGKHYSATKNIKVTIGGCGG